MVVERQKTGRVIGKGLVSALGMEVEGQAGVKCDDS